MISNLCVLGAGGHAKVVIELVRSDGRYRPCLVLDLTAGTELLGVPVEAESEYPSLFARYAIKGAVLGLGDIDQRVKLAEKFRQIAFPPLRCATAHVSAHTSAGDGCTIMPGAIVNPDTSLGRHTIVNTGAIVEHDCRVGDFSHVAPGARLAGGVQVGERTLVGVGAVVLPGVKVGNRCVVGAGSVVTKNVGHGEVVVGTPARVLSRAVESE